MEGPAKKLISEEGVLTTTPAMLRAEKEAKENLISPEGVLRTTPSMLRAEQIKARADQVDLAEQRRSADSSKVAGLKEKILGLLDRNKGKK